MSEKSVISNAVIRRLPRYRRYLKELKNQNIDKISSRGLSELTGYTASQIRQDFNNFGGFGQQGYGYNVNSLYNEISAILGLDREYKMVMIGAGHLGQAIVNHNHYYKSGFVIQAIFEVNEDIIGKSINDIPVYDYRTLEEYISKNKIDIGIICANKESAQEIADILCGAGIKGIWNFAPIDIDTPSSIPAENVHLSDTLHSLAYYLNNTAQE